MSDLFNDSDLSTTDLSPRARKWMIIARWAVKILVSIITSAATVFGIEACVAFPCV